MEINLAEKITKTLQNFNKDIEKGLAKAQLIAAKDAVNELHGTSPRKTGDYAESWTQRKTPKGRIIYAKKPYYRLTHLLEKSHVTGRNRKGHYSGRPHIAPAEKRAVAEYLTKTEEILRNGGIT
jgi:hypothetical protein